MTFLGGCLIEVSPRKKSSLPWHSESFLCDVHTEGQGPGNIKHMSGHNGSHKCSSVSGCHEGLYQGLFNYPSIYPSMHSSTRLLTCLHWCLWQEKWVQSVYLRISVFMDPSCSLYAIWITVQFQSLTQHGSTSSRFHNSRTSLPFFPLGAGVDNKNRHAMNFPGMAAVFSFPKSWAGTWQGKWGDKGLTKKRYKRDGQVAKTRRWR